MTYLLAVWEYTLVFILAAIPWIEIGVVIPLAIIKGLNPILVGVLSFLGNLATVYLLIIFIERYQQWRNKGKDQKADNSKRGRRAVEIWNKYGLPGLAFLGPLVTGSHLAVIIGIAFGAAKNRTAIWITISLGLWTIILTAASHYGIDFLGTLTRS